MSDDRDREFADFVLARGSATMRLALYLTAGDLAAAEDLAQSALARLYVYWNRVEKPQAREAYLRQIMARHAWRDRRHAARERAGAVALAGNDGRSAAPGPGPDRVAFLELLGTLPTKQRAVLVLRYYADMTEAEIADALGCARGTVKAHASRALTSLRSKPEIKAFAKDNNF